MDVLDNVETLVDRLFRLKAELVVEEELRRNREDVVQDVIDQLGPAIVVVDSIRS